MTAPNWRLSKRAALEAWREALPLADRAAYETMIAEAKAAKAARRAARVAKRKARETEDSRIVAHLMLGLSSYEISDVVGIPSRQVRRRVEHLGFRRSPPAHRRVPEAFIPVATRDSIAAVAAERRESLAATVEAVLTYAFEENAAVARRLLRAV